MTPLEEKIDTIIKYGKEKGLSAEVQMWMFGQLCFISEESVRQERQRIFDSLPEFGRYNHDLHTHRWSKDGFDRCITQVRNIISKPNI